MISARSAPRLARSPRASLRAAGPHPRGPELKAPLGEDGRIVRIGLLRGDEILPGSFEDYPPGNIPALRAFGASASSLNAVFAPRSDGGPPLDGLAADGGRPGSLRSLSFDEYTRLLGYPAGKLLEGELLARAEEAIAWYERHGNPRVESRDFGNETVAAITAGPEVAAEVARLWAADRVDEAYFLDRLAAAVVEHLALSLGNGRSPGHKGFPLEEQSKLYALVEPEGIELLPSGMLRPVHSLLAVYGPEVASVSPCSRCDWRCRYRRKAA